MASHPRPGPWWGLACLGVAAAFFVLGTFVYVTCRPRQPLLFTILGIGPAPFLNQCAGVPWHLWFPTFAHVSAFSFATCALLAPRMRSVLVAAGGWTFANLVWEFRSISSGTLDLPDVLAACLAFGVVVGVASVLQRVPLRVREVDL